MKNKPSHVVVTQDRKYSSSDRMIRRFIKLCKKEGIREEFKSSTSFKTKSQKRREKDDRAMRRRKREERKAARPRSKSVKSF